MARHMDMTEGKIMPKVLIFCLPLMAASILQLLFNAIDIVVVGQFAGKVSLAAVSSTSSLIHLTTNLFIGLSVGCNVVVARHLGSGRYKEVYEAVHTSVLLAIVSGIVMTALGVLMAPQMLILMKTPDDVISLSEIYLRIYFLGMPAVMLYNFGAAILRAQGDTKRPLYALLIAGILNALMNLVFVVVIRMDVAGVGLATTISQYVSAIIIINVLVNEDSVTRLYLNQLKFDKTQLVEIVKIGLPAGIQGTMFSISNVVIQSSINSFNSTIMAGSGAASNIEGFVYVAMNAFHQGALTFISQNVGAGKKERINSIMFTCQFLVIVTGLIFGVGSYLLGDKLVAIYNGDPEVIAAGIVRLRYISLPYALCGIMDVMVGALRGLGQAVGPMVISLLGVCVFRLGWIATAFRQYHTIEMLYLSYPISWIIVFVVDVVFYIIVKRKYDREFDLQHQEV